MENHGEVTAFSTVGYLFPSQCKAAHLVYMLILQEDREPLVAAVDRLRDRWMDGIGLAKGSTMH